jgi:ATP-dependent DNA helicase
MMVMQLRKVCNHPYLFLIQTDNVENPSVNGIPEILAWSGKMMLLDRLLPALIEKGHKVLIFSQMTNMLNIIEDYLTFVRKISFCRIDGSVSLRERTTEIASFQDSKQDFKVFLLSTRAGGLGLNLVAADTVIIFDSDWNPQVDLQAQDRVHRFGQSKPVIIYRFLAADSIEKRILERARAKRTLEKIVIHKSKTFDFSHFRQIQRQKENQ